MAVRYDAIIIGGGISGLAAAFNLKRGGLKPLVLDAPAPGGLIRSRSIDGFSLELGANTLVLTPPMEELLTSLGLRSAVRHPAIEKYRQYVWCSGAAVEVPKSPPKFLTSPLFSVGEKARVLRGLGRTPRAHELSSTASVADLFGSLLGQAPVEKVLAPVLRGIFGGSVHELRAAAVFPKLARHLAGGGSLFSYGQEQRVLRRRIFCLAGGNELICTRLRDALGEAVHSCAAAALDRQGDAFRVSSADGTVYETAEVIVATAGAASGKLFEGLRPNLVEAARDLRFAPIIAIHFEIPRDARLPADGFGVLFPAAPGSSLLGIMFNSLIFPHVAPSSSHLVTVCLGGVGNEDVLGQSEDELLKAAASALHDKLGVSPRRALSLQLWPRGIPQYDARHAKLLAAFEAAEKALPGLSFVGADIGGVGVPNRVERAFETASKVLVRAGRAHSVTPPHAFNA